MSKVQERSQSRRRRVLDAALLVFAERGYNDTAVDDVARASATSKGGLYFHFPSKQVLFIALLDEMSEVLLERVKSAMSAETDPLAQGEAALREVLHAFAEHRLLARLLLIEALGAGSEFTAKLNELHVAFTALITGCLEEAVRQGQLPPLDAEIAASAWYGAVNHVVLRWLMTGKPRHLEATFPALRELLLFGVTGPAQRIPR